MIQAAARDKKEPEIKSPERSEEEMTEIERQRKLPVGRRGLGRGIPFFQTKLKSM